MTSQDIKIDQIRCAKQVVARACDFLNALDDESEEGVELRHEARNARLAAELLERGVEDEMPSCQDREAVSVLVARCWALIERVRPYAKMRGLKFFEIPASTPAPPRPETPPPDDDPTEPFVRSDLPPELPVVAARAR